MSGRGWWLTLRPPERVSELVAALQEVSLFPEGRTWWFAWNGLDIVLPGKVTDDADLDSDWDVVRVFSPQAELRVGRRGRGRGCWLLLEEDPQDALGDQYDAWVDDQAPPATFAVEGGHHILAGVKLRLPDGEKRGEIFYPRPLNYGIDDDDLEQALVAAVRAYYDNARRLATVRYASIESAALGSIPVDPFPEPKEALGLTPNG